MKRRSNRFLTWALAISLAAHAILIYWAQDLSRSQADPEQPVQHFRIDRPKRVPPPPTVIVTPKPVVPATPQQTTRHQPPAPPRVSSGDKTSSGNRPGPIVGPDSGPSGVGPTGPVEPSAPTEAPTASCAAPDVPAHVVDTATAETPEVAQEQGLTGTTQVEVSIDPDGAITATSIYRSSGSQALDTAALAAARQSTYKADVRNCEAVAGSYLFTVVFQ